MALGVVFIYYLTCDCRGRSSNVPFDVMESQFAVDKNRIDLVYKLVFYT